MSANWTRLTRSDVSCASAHHGQHVLATWRVDAGGNGSFYCDTCRNKIVANPLPAMKPTEEAMSRAHAAFEDMAAEWTLRRVNNYGLMADVWVLEYTPSISTYAPTKDYANEIAGHRFDGPEAKQKALLFKRDKCLRAAIEAAMTLDNKSD